jgi:tousled-like kinase
LLGKGGYSEVYRAFDLDNNVETACKIHELNPNWSENIKSSYIKHAIRENQICRMMRHSKVVSHYDTLEIDNSSFCTVLELCSGPDLYTYLKLNKTVPESEARIIISQILLGLKYLNDQKNKIIHFDLKPQNILFHNGEIKISDFGLAKLLDEKSENIELTSQGVGTYWYLPPECFDTGMNNLIDNKVKRIYLG